MSNPTGEALAAASGHPVVHVVIQYYWPDVVDVVAVFANGDDARRAYAEGGDAAAGGHTEIKEIELK